MATSLTTTKAAATKNGGSGEHVGGAGRSGGRGKKKTKDEEQWGMEKNLPKLTYFSPSSGVGRRASKSAKYNAFRDPLLQWVDSGTSTVVVFQNFFGAQSVMGESKVKPTLLEKFWSYYFRFAAEFGNEMFFILALPWMYWNVPNDLARMTVFLWGAAYYIGQSIKDYLQLPRPPCPPVVRLENWYEAEYGLPSTHVMGAVTIPGYISMYCIAHDYWSPLTALCFFLLYSLSVTGSRLYLGVHSPADLITGFSLALGILGFSLFHGGNMDRWLMTDPYAIVVVPIACVLLLSIYPAPRKWTNAYGDSAVIIGVVCGVFVGGHWYYHEEFFYNHTDNIGSIITSASYLLGVVYRCLAGFPVLFLTRMVFKATTVPLLHAVLPKSSTPPAKRYAVEIPAKFITYGMVGFNAAYTVPYLHHILNIL
eukprot:Nk52_evm8s545 gene=Nk52_evmTU8s545